MLGAEMAEMINSPPICHPPFRLNSDYLFDQVAHKGCLKSP
jgi:hypothetical protein